MINKNATQLSLESSYVYWNYRAVSLLKGVIQSLREKMKFSERNTERKRY